MQIEAGRPGRDPSQGKMLSRKRPRRVKAEYTIVNGQL